MGLATNVWTPMLLLGALCARAADGDASQRSEWPLPGGNVQSQQYSELDQINTGNIGALGLLWYSDLPVGEGLVGNPLVKDGVVYQSAPRARIVATDMRTGKTRWLFVPTFDMSGYSIISMFMVNVNRGLTLDEKSVYVAGGCELYAVDRKTGKEVWHSQVCDPKLDLGVVAPPQVGNGKVYVGISNMQMGTARSFAAGHDAGTGKELWRFYTVPGDPAKPHENEQMRMASATWGPNYWKQTRGAGGVWSGMVYDPNSDLFIFGAGNPGVDGHEKEFADQEMLFADSIIAVNATTGAYAWHLQEVKGDVFHPGDATAHIMLADLAVNGVPRHVLMQAAKNGYFYLIDAKTGKFISTNNYVPVVNFDPKGTKSGTFEYRKEMRFWNYPDKQIVLQPGGWGAHTWELSSYNPKLGLVFIPSFILPYMLSQSTASAPLKEHENYGFTEGAAYRTHGRLVAWDPATQTERWHVDHPVPLNGGVLSTAGGVVFQGTPGKFHAYDGASGTELWTYDTHAVVLAGASTVMIDGMQVLLVPSGDGTATTAAGEKRLMSTPDTMAAPSRLLAFALGGKAVLPAPKPYRLLQPARPKQPAALAVQGEKIIRANFCEACHGDDLVNSGNGIVPDLRNIREERLQAMPAILQQGAFAPLGMPRFPNLTSQDIAALQAYLTNLGWAEYERQQGQSKAFSY